MLSLAMIEWDLELYRHIVGFPEGDSASEIDMKADDDEHVSDISIHRARVVVAEMDFRREVADRAGRRSADLRSSYWAYPIAVGRIQIAMGVKVVALSNLGYGKYEISYDELPDGVIDFAPDSLDVLRRDGPHYELRTDGSGMNSFLYIELHVDARWRLIRRGFFASIRYAPSKATRSTPTPSGSEILEGPDHPGGQNQAPIDSAFPTSNNLGGVGHGRVSAMTGEEAIAMYLIDCAPAWNSGGDDYCFPICREQATGHIAYFQRVLLSDAMTAGDSELYHSILARCEAELESPTADQANGVAISEIRMARSRIVIEVVEF